MTRRVQGGMRRYLAGALAVPFFWALSGIGIRAAHAGQTGGQEAVSFQALSLIPEKVVFDALVGSSVTLTQDVDVYDNSGAALEAYTATIQSGSDWLLIGNAIGGTTVTWGRSISGKLPGVLRVFAKVAGLTAGIHTGAIAVSFPGNTANSFLLPVIINVRNRPNILLQPSALTFSHQAGNRFNKVEPQTLSVFGGVTDFRILVSGGYWLTVSPTASTTPADLTVKVDATGLDPGSYQGTISFVAPNASNSGLTATVTLNVTEPSVYRAVPGSISLQALYGSQQPVSAAVSLYTNGDMLPVTTQSLNPSWLSMTSLDSWVGVQDGSTGMIMAVPAKTRIYADPTGLPIGTYSSSIIVGDGSSAITIPVTFKVIPNVLVIPHVKDGGGWHTEITLVNTDKAEAPFTLKFRQADGTPLILPVYSVGFVSEFKDIIPAFGSLTYQTANWNPTVSQGWAELIPERAIGGSATVHLLGTGSDSAASVPVAPPAGRRFLLPFDNTDSVQTDLAIVNSGNSPATVSLILRDENGTQVASDSITLPPYGERNLQLRDAYPQLVNQRGAAEFKSSSDGTTALGLRSNLLGGLTSFQPVVSRPSGTDTVTRTLAQVVDGNGWRTAFTLINPGLKPVPFSVVFHDGVGGYPNELPLYSIGNTAEYSDVVPAGGLRVFETSGTSDPLAQRWAEIVSSVPLGGTLIFAQSNPDGSESDGSLEITPPASDHFVLPFDNTNGLVTAVALLNESHAEQRSTVTLRDESGKRLSTEYLTLAPMTSESFFLSGQYPALDGVRGSVEFFGAQFSVLGLRFGPLGSLAAVNPVSK